MTFYDFKANLTGKIIFMPDRTHSPSQSGMIKAEGNSFRLIFRYNPLPMYIYDKSTFYFLDVNPAAIEHYGYTREEFLSMTIFDIRPSEDIQVFREFLESRREEFYHEAEWLHRKKDGTVFWVSVDSHEFNYGEKPARLVFARDITERKNAEMELYCNKEFAERINHTIPDILYIFDAVEHRNIFCNNSIFERAGYTPAEIKALGSHLIQTVIHPDDLDRFLEHQSKYETLKDAEMLEIEYRMLLKQGGFRWFHSRESLFKKDENGRVRQIIGLCRDIHDRRTSEEQLLQREAFFKSIFDGVSTSIVVLEKGKDDVWLFVAMNEASRRMAGTDIANTLLFKSMDICRGFLSQELYQELEMLFQECTEQKITTEKDIALSEDDDSSWWHVRFSPVLHSAGYVFRVIVFVQSISDQKRETERKERAQRLESVGLLAGGIAHDFNNFLSTVVMSASLIKSKEPADSENLEYLEDILKVCDEAKQLTKQLLTFAKGGAPLKEVTDLGELLREASRFALRGSQISCAYDIKPDLFKVNVDPGQIKQVIYNLVLNARQVLGEGGKVSLFAENIEIPCESGQVKKFVSFSVSDNGPGIPKEAQRNIFNPYFTTKKTGSGLGLATSYSIIEKHGGSIQFQSVTGKGTSFSVTLPASVDTEPLRQQPVNRLVQGHGLIMLMDDNEMILNTLAETLKILGYEAVKTADGESCVTEYLKLRDAGRSVDAFILDLTIQGGVGGVETLSRLKKIDPEVKAIASSGYSEEDTMMSFSEMGFCGALPKPYRLTDLSQILSEVTGKTS